MWRWQYTTDPEGTSNWLDYPGPPSDISLEKNTEVKCYRQQTSTLRRTLQLNDTGRFYRCANQWKGRLYEEYAASLYVGSVVHSGKHMLLFLTTLLLLLLLVVMVVVVDAGCVTSQQHAGVSLGRICSDNFTCCTIEIEVSDQTFCLTQSLYADTGPTIPSSDPIAPGAWQGTHWSANF